MDNEAEVGFDYEFYAEDNYDAEADKEAAMNSDLDFEVQVCFSLHPKESAFLDRR